MTAEDSLHVVVADPTALMRAGLRQSLSTLAAGVSLHETHDADGLERLLTRGAPVDLVIADMRLPGAADIRHLCAIVARASGRTVLMQDHHDAAGAIVALSSGVAGVVLKSTPEPVLQAALRFVLAGGNLIEPEILLYASRGRDCVACAADRLSEPVASSARMALAHLTPRQREVLELMRDGHSNKEIAQRLGLTEGTVKVHVTRILQVLNARSRLKAVAMSRHSAQSPVQSGRRDRDR